MKRLLMTALSGVAAACWLSACHTPAAPHSETAPSDWNVLGEKALKCSHGKIDFVTHVKPVLEAKCVVCHNRQTLPFFSLENRALAFASPPRIVPGHPELSLLIINGTQNHAKTMPPVGERLTLDEKRILTEWVRQGAHWPDGAAGTLKRQPS